MSMYASSPRWEKKDREQRTILVIDDDPVIGIYLKNILSSSGYHVLEARSGTKGLETARQKKPDIVLLDVILPDGNGVDFCRAVKQDPLLDSVYVILMSGMVTSGKEQAVGLDAGADDYVTKPLETHELLARIEALLRIKRAEEALQESRRLLQMTQRLARVGGWEWDVVGEHLSWTEETYRIHGFSPHERLSSKQRLERCLECYGIEDRQTFQDAFRMCIEHGEPFDREFPFQSADGRKLWVRTVGEAVKEDDKVVRVVGTIMDITRRKTGEEQLKRVSDEYERVFHSTQDAMFLVEVLDGPTFRFIRNNNSHQKKTGLTAEAIRGKTPRELLGEEMGDVVADNYMYCLGAGKPISYEENLDLPGGLRIWNTTLTPVYENGNIAYIVGSSQDITRRKQAEDQLRILATTDELTELWNRRYFMDAFRCEAERVRRYGLFFALLILDIDHFKGINDEYGHAVGDLALKHFADMLKKQLRQVDVPGRIGGEEFAVLLPQTDLEGAVTFAERLRQSVAQSQVCVEQLKVSFTISIGATACGGGSSSDVDEIFKQADDALYQAKSQGRNRVVMR